MKFKRLIAFVLLIVLLLVSGCNKPKSYSPETEVLTDTEFKIFFLDVGQADSALVVCDGYTMLID